MESTKPMAPSPSELWRGSNVVASCAVPHHPDTPTEPETTPRGVIAGAIAGVMGELEALPHDGVNDRFNYRYTSDAAIANALRPLLAKHGLAIIPGHVKLLAQSEHPTGNGKMRVVLIEVRYEILHNSGAVFSCATVAEAMDTLDKAFQKALTAAYKSLLIQVFCIGRGVDGDADNGRDDRPRDDKPAARGRRDTKPKPAETEDSRAQAAAVAKLSDADLVALRNDTSKPWPLRRVAVDECLRRKLTKD